MLKVVLVPTEHDPHTRLPESLHQRMHVAGVVVAGACTVRRVMTKRNAPAHLILGGYSKAGFQKCLVFRVLDETPRSEEVLFRRVEADEFDVGAKAHAVEQTR